MFLLPTHALLCIYSPQTYERVSPRFTATMARRAEHRRDTPSSLAVILSSLPQFVSPYLPFRGEVGAVNRRRQPPRKEREGVVEDEEDEAERSVGMEIGAGEDEAAACSRLSSPWPCGAYATRAIRAMGASGKTVEWSRVV